MHNPSATAISSPTFLSDYRSHLVTALELLDLQVIDNATRMLLRARDSGRTIFTCGNGGSASTASHLVCDIIKGASFNRASRFRIMALTDSLPTITAYSNDVNYEAIFIEQLKNLAQTGDVLISISGSGNSPNVLRATEYANSIGCETIALTGRDGGKLGALAKLEIRVQSPHMGQIEDAHMVICHMMSYLLMEQHS